MLKIFEILGKISGWLLGLLTGSISLVRQSRMFHPRGLTYIGRAEKIDPVLALPPFVLFRFSSAWWKNQERRDVLGIALRFSPSGDFTEVAKSNDQDLLFATVENP